MSECYMVDTHGITISMLLARIEMICILDTLEYVLVLLQLFSSNKS
jgi:hypothetical protein